MSRVLRRGLAAINSPQPLQYDATSPTANWSAFCLLARLFIMGPLCSTGPLIRSGLNCAVCSIRHRSEELKSFAADLRSAAEPQPKETSTTEARRHGENSKANNQQSKSKPQHRETPEGAGS